MQEGPTVTRLLRAWRAGEASAFDEVVQTVYDDLVRIARAHLRGEQATPSLEPAGLVHEAYVRLRDAREIDWQSRVHFQSVASRVMRRVLVERARARGRKKRKALMVPLQEATSTTPALDVDVLDLEAALARLEERGLHRECRVVELRFFGGLTEEEAAAELGLSAPTVRRAWALGRSFLKQQLQS